MAMAKGTIPNGNAVEKHKLVCATGDTNHNKYWQCVLYDSGDVEIEFGRIGVTSSRGVHFGAGRHFMEKKMREKQKGKVNKSTGQREPYFEIEVIDGDTPTAATTKAVSKDKLKDIAKNQIKHSSPETGKLIEWLADINRHQITDATGGKVAWNADKGLFATPLGIITPNAVSEARNLLVKIGDFVADRDFVSHDFKKTVDRYMTIVPQNVGMRWNHRSVFPDLSSVQKQGGILDALDASYISATSMPEDIKKNKKVDQPKVFETKLVLIEDGRVFDRLNKKFKKNVNVHHRDTSRMKLHKVWEVEIGPVFEMFKQISKRLGNVMELFHGTNAANLLSCLKVGLRIAPPSSAHVTGKMWGNGVYASSQSSKALNYATSFWGGRDLGRYFMFLVDFIMGKTFVPPARFSGKLPKLGYDSTYAKAGVSGKPGRSTLLNDEQIVYKDNQVNLKYLLEFKR